jgi:transcriptional regulator with XRE-family HTH domain
MENFFPIMVTGKTIRAKRRAHGIVGQALSKKSGYSRTWLSNLERQYITPSNEDLLRVDAALEALIAAKTELQRTAEALGWPLEAVR